MTDNNNIKALCAFLSIPETDVKVSGYNGNLIEVLSGDHEGEEYFVGTEDEVEKLAIDDVVEILDDLGLEAVSDGFLERCLEEVNCPWKEWMDNDHRSYCEDIIDEPDYTGVYSNRLEQEAVENGLVEDNDFEKNEEGLLHYKGNSDDLIDLMIDYMSDNYSSMSEYFENNFGKHWVSEMKETLEKYINYEDVARKVIEEDGVANTLARYDGKEHEVDINGETYYIYRSN